MYIINENEDLTSNHVDKSLIKKSLKEEKATDSLFEDVVFSMIKKFKLKKEYDVERPSWSVFNFRNKNKDAQFAITFDEHDYGDFLYGDVLAFGDEKDDIFKYKTDEVKVDSYDIEKECSNIIADCLAFIDTNKKITIFESKKFARKSLKESTDDDIENYIDNLRTYSKKNIPSYSKSYYFWSYYEFNISDNEWTKISLSGRDYAKSLKDANNLAKSDDVVKAYLVFKNPNNPNENFKVIIKENDFYESKKSARKSIKEERYNVELSDYSGSIVDEETFDKKSDAIQWAKDNGRNCYARIWDNEEGKTVKEWKVKSIKESSFSFTIEVDKGNLKLRDVIKDMFDEFKNKKDAKTLTWKSIKEGLSFSGDEDEVFAFQDYLLDHIYEYGDYELDRDYVFVESKKSARKNLKEDEVVTLQDIWDANNKDLFLSTIWNLRSQRILSNKEYNTLKELYDNWEEYKNENPNGKILYGNIKVKVSKLKNLKESTDESFSLYDLNKHDPFIKEWVKNINKELRDVSIESIGDDEIVFRVWFDETIDLNIFDDIATDCMPSLLIEFMSDMNIDFGYQFVYADDKFTENDYVFIRFVAW